jgi:hypothetical protein
MLAMDGVVAFAQQWTLVVMGPGSRFACPGRRRVCCPLKQFQTRHRDPAARCARVVHKIFRPLEGVGNAGCPLHPRPRVHFVLVERTRATTSTPESPDIPARNGFNGLCRALSGDRALLPPSSRGYLACPHPVGPTCLPQDLTPASGRQDHTILPSAATSLVRPLSDRSQIQRTRPAIPSRAKRCRVHRIPCLRP